MSAHLCLALLALCSLTTASDPECAELLKPLEERGQVSGKWIFHVGTSDNEESLKGLKDFNSSRIELSPIPDSDNMTLHWMDRVNGKCIHGDVTATFLRNDSSDISFQHPHSRACWEAPEDLRWVHPVDRHRSVEGERETKQGRHLFLFTNSGKLDDADLDVFKKQAACLNLLAEFHFGETTDLCPEEEEAATDVKEEEH